MALIRFREVVWNNPAHQELLKYVSAALLLGEPAQYDIDPGNQRWLVFSDTRFTLEHMAWLGALTAFDLDDLPADWALPTIISFDWETGESTDTEIVIRDEAQAQIEALVAGVIVLPDAITYADEDPNVWQTTLDANNAPATVKAENAPDPAWTPVSEL